MIWTSRRRLRAHRSRLSRRSRRRASRFAVLWNPSHESSADHLKRAQIAAQGLRLQLQPVGTSNADGLQSAFAAVIQARADALLVVADPTFFLHGSRLAELAAMHRMPTMFGFREHVEAGGLMAYASDAADLFRRAAHYVDRILKGSKRAELPVEQPTKFELVVNLKTARALGVTLLQSILLRADQVIE
jgi:putative ABC transport system substrate-binding protein